MGSSQSNHALKLSPNFSVVKPYVPSQWVSLHTASNYQIWTKVLTSVKYHAYYLNDQILKNTSQIQKYQFRKQHPSNIVSVFNLLHIAHDQNICGQINNKIILITQYIEKRFYNIRKVTFSEALTIIYYVLLGLDTLSCFYGPLIPNQDIICFDMFGHVKIWLNEDLALNEPSESVLFRKDNLDDFNKRANYSINLLIRLVMAKTIVQIPYSFYKEIQNKFAFSQAINFIKQYSQKYKIPINSQISEESLNNTIKESIAKPLSLSSRFNQQIYRESPKMFENRRQHQNIKSLPIQTQRFSNQYTQYPNTNNNYPNIKTSRTVSNSLNFSPAKSINSSLMFNKTGQRRSSVTNHSNNPSFQSNNLLFMKYPAKAETTPLSQKLLVNNKNSKAKVYINFTNQSLFNIIGGKQETPVYKLRQYKNEKLKKQSELCTNINNNNTAKQENVQRQKEQQLNKIQDQNNNKKKQQLNLQIEVQNHMINYCGNHFINGNNIWTPQFSNSNSPTKTIKRFMEEQFHDSIQNTPQKTQQFKIQETKYQNMTEKQIQDYIKTKHSRNNFKLPNDQKQLSSQCLFRPLKVEMSSQDLINNNYQQTKEDAKNNLSIGDLEKGIQRRLIEKQQQQKKAKQYATYMYLNHHVPYNVYLQMKDSQRIEEVQEICQMQKDKQAKRIKSRYIKPKSAIQKNYEKKANYTYTEENQEKQVKQPRYTLQEKIKQAERQYEKRIHELDQQEAFNKIKMKNINFKDRFSQER